MYRRIVLLLCWMLGFTAQLPAQKLIEAGMGYSSTSVNTAIFRTNSVTSKGNVQFIAYYDAEGYLTLGKRRLGNDRFETLRSRYKGKCQDAHNVISIGIDGKGYLHVAFDHHNAALHYCRSIAPYSLELGEMQPMVGREEVRVTYPEFYTLKNGDLLFAYRYGKSGRGNLMLNRYDVRKGEWQRLQDTLIDGENLRNAYWQLCVDKEGTIHISWVWRETAAVETNHDLCYARSRDGGITWEKSTGEPYQLPITMGNAEYAFKIPQKSELINQTSMVADKQGNPYIAAYWKNQNDRCPQYRLVFKEEGQWKMVQVADRKGDFSLSGRGTKMIPIARPRLAIDKKGGIYYLFRDKDRGSKVSVAYTSHPTQGNWTVRDLTNFTVDAWEPSYDTNLWNHREQLHIFVQHTSQGDGEKVKLSEPTPVYVLEVDKKQLRKAAKKHPIPVSEASKPKKEDTEWIERSLETAAYQLEKSAEKYSHTKKLPRFVLDNGEIQLCDIYDWTSGFFPGSLWYAYELTGKEELKRQAIKYTNLLYPLSHHKGNHDLGFMMNCSYGNALRLSFNDSIREALIKTADNLCLRFNEKIGCIRSWDFGTWNYPVIIDNMMNLELLFNAFRLTGEKKYYDIAVKHALTTMKHHFRPDHTSYHVVSYNNDGTVESKGTHQGMNDESAWARGQAWAVYGYTLCYRETDRKEFLQKAIDIADMIMNRVTTNDAIPYWDYDAPADSSTPRDASAAAITASAFLELGTFLPKGEKYIKYAKNILKQLSTPRYLAQKDTNHGFVLMHSVGSFPHNSEVDTPLNYADYYYLEAIKRLQDLRN